jgi:hypothetical protein
MHDCLNIVPLCLPQHDHRNFVADIVDETGAPVDITTSAVTWILADSVTGTIRLTRSTGAGTMIKSSATRVQWSITSAQSGALTPRSYHHEMQITNSAGEKQTVMVGRFDLIDTRISDA